MERETGEHNIVVELWEWGGVVTKSSVLQRALRCIPFDGIVFVYDLTISATRDSLWKFWAVQVRRSFGDLEGGEDNYNTNLFQSQGWKRIVDMLMYVFLQLVCVLPFANTHWKEKMEAYYLYQISRQLPLAVVGTKSDIWSQRRKRRLHKSSPMDGIFYCLWNAEETNQNRSFWNFLHAVLERKTNKTNKQQHG